LWGPGAEEDGFAEIAEALEGGVGSAGLLVHLLQEKIEEGRVAQATRWRLYCG